MLEESVRASVEEVGQDSNVDGEVGGGVGAFGGHGLRLLCGYMSD